MGIYHILNKTGMLYVISTDEDQIFTETPDDQALEDDELAECLLRVFYAPQDADLYLESLAGYSDEKLEVVKMSMKDLFDNVEEMTQESLNIIGCPIRVELCEVPTTRGRPDHPVEIDTLFSFYDIFH